MAVSLRQCALVVLAAVSVVVHAEAQATSKLQSGQPYKPKVDCAHPRLLAGMEAKWAELPEISSFLAAAKISELLNGVYAFHRYTILAPTNEAFNKLATAMGLSSADDLLADDQKDFLTEVIRFHFGLAAAHYTTALQQGSTELRVFAVDQFLHASTVNGKVQFVGPSNKATVVKPDVELCNSVLHVVDTVIVPAGYEHVLKGAGKPAAATVEL